MEARYFRVPDSYDAAAGRYRGLEAGCRPNVQLNSESIVVSRGCSRTDGEGGRCRGFDFYRHGGVSTATADGLAGSGNRGHRSPASGAGVPQTASVKPPG